MSVVSYRHDYISEQDYLESEKISDIKHEYIDGDVYAMAGASKNHQLIISKIIQKFSNHLEGTSCDAISSDIRSIFILMLSSFVIMKMKIPISPNPHA